MDGTAGRAHQDSAGVRVEAPPGLTADIDPDRLRQALDNLLDNAFRAVGPGGEVLLRARIDDDLLLIEVIDEGPGFPDSFLPVAFERFRRPDSARTRACGGAGLGLSIVRAIAEAHGGRVEAANRPRGKGAVVRIILLDGSPQVINAPS